MKPSLKGEKANGYEEWNALIIQNPQIFEEKKKANKVGHETFSGVKLWDRKKEKGTEQFSGTILTLKTPSGAALLEIREIPKL